MVRVNEVAAEIVSDWIEFVGSDDAWDVIDFLSCQTDAVIAQVASYGDAVVELVSEAKDIIERNHLAATGDSGYRDAKAEGALGRRG